MTSYTIGLQAAGVTFDATHFDSLFDLYLADCERSGVVEKTIQSYTHQLRPFRSWWAEYGPAHDYQLSQTAMQDFDHYLRKRYQTQLGKPAAQNTQRSGARRVRQFFGWLYRTGRLPMQISEWVALPAASLPEGRCLDTWELEAVMNACYGLHKIRNAALVAFLFETGVRCIEAAGVTFDATTILADNSGYTRLDIVKGNRDIDMRRTVAFGPLTGVLLRILAFTTGRTTGKLFDLSDKGIQFAVRRLAHRAGIDVTTHDGRRTFATYWVRNYQGKNAYLGELLLKKQLGHRPANVTERHYLNLDHNDILKDYVSPFDSCHLPGLKPATAIVKATGHA